MLARPPANDAPHAGRRLIGPVGMRLPGGGAIFRAGETGRRVAGLLAFVYVVGRLITVRLAIETPPVVNLR